jgi:hypothetical protein
VNKPCVPWTAGAQLVGAIAGVAIARAVRWVFFPARIAQGRDSVTMCVSGRSPGAFRAIGGGVNRLNVSWGGCFLAEILGVWLSCHLPSLQTVACTDGPSDLWPGTLLIVYTFLVAYDKSRRWNSPHVNVSFRSAPRHGMRDLILRLPCRSWRRG